MLALESRDWYTVASAMAATRLNAVQLRTLNEVILALYEDLSTPQSLDDIMDLFEVLMPVSWASMDEVILGTNRMLHRGGRNLMAIPDVDERLTKYGHQNPVVAWAQGGNPYRALRISDFATFREFRETAFYHEVVGLLPGWRDQVAVPIPLPGSIAGFTLNREKTFTDEERLMLELFHPHLERALHRNVQFAGLDTKPPLTPREREVLHWLAEGKRDSEIATILRISVRTIEQHVRVCLQKLGVETRTAAVAAVWRARMK